MATPRRNFNYNSPYAHPVKQYPSQSEDYISLDMGGSKQQYSSFSDEKTPDHCNLKYYQQNFRNSNCKANRRNLFNDNYGQQNRKQSFNQQRYGSGNGSFNQQRYGSGNGSEWSHHKNIRNSNEKRSQPQHHNDTKPIASYIHPSMTEDPWFELTQRLRSLEKSQISLKDVSPPLDRSSTANSDEEAESATSD